ncbi:MAG: hypothetical protein V1754_15825, partial [Pseudomonadota bacterium]
AQTLAGTIGAATEGDEGAEANAPSAGGMLAMGAQMMGSVFEQIRNALEQSIRRVHLRVIWKEGNKEKSVSVVAYFTDPRKVDDAIGGRLGGVVGGTPVETATPPATGSEDVNTGRVK